MNTPLLHTYVLRDLERCRRRCCSGLNSTKLITDSWQDNLEQPKKSDLLVRRSTLCVCVFFGGHDRSVDIG